MGNFKCEIQIFMPYVNYLVSILDYDEIFISSHYNREFLYSYIKNINYHSIFGIYTRNELYQTGIVYKDINKQNFNQISRMIKNDIGDVDEQYTLPYVKNTNSISTFQKLFKPFGFNHIHSNDIYFIPDKTEECKKLYDDIKNQYNINILGDMNNGLSSYNKLLRNSIYSEIIYKTILKRIQKSLFVITPCSEYVIICNLHNIPVLYWGNDASLYKYGGLYGFGNENVVSIKEFNISMIEYVYNKQMEKHNAGI